MYHHLQLRKVGDDQCSSAEVQQRLMDLTEGLGEMSTMPEA